MQVDGTELRILKATTHSQLIEETEQGEKEQKWEEVKSKICLGPHLIQISVEGVEAQPGFPAREEGNFFLKVCRQINCEINFSKWPLANQEGFDTLL